MSLSYKNTKNIKTQDQIRLKKNISIGTLAIWNFKTQVRNLNFGQISMGKISNFKPQIDNLISAKSQVSKL